MKELQVDISGIASATDDPNISILAIQPPPPKICESLDGAPITANRIKLRDERYLAYKEHGVAKEMEKHKLIFVHGFASCRHDEALVSQLSLEVVEELGIYSCPLIDQELFDQLRLGSKFYLVGYSMGGHAVWSCLKYIPHRLAGATLVAPVVNYWWPVFLQTYLKKHTIFSFLINGRCMLLTICHF
ncbi:hypothetical protein PVK06_043648 [Gossypium arboreum]|uniref:Serine aminopeptidase S33 domain-containing protein n=1 Tax=Gossypium arboreum TaxID=29729 RepID=A0ABR0MQU2_GOSAR|nr:hypothetical protein PVK06_043648 [Gossypium arboreum]